MLYGGPLLFLLFGALLVLWVLGPAPPPNPIAEIRSGKVVSGMSIDQVIAAIGRPKGIEPREDGGMTFRYRHGTSEPFVEEDAYVDINAAGFVFGTSIERVSVPAAPER